MALAASLTACQSSDRQKQVTSTTVMGAGLGVFGGPIGAPSAPASARQLAPYCLKEYSINHKPVRQANDCKAA
jgi:hypothetical protein